MGEEVVKPATWRCGQVSNVPPEKVLEVILEGLYEGVEDTEVAELPGHPGRVLDQEDLQEDQLQALDHLHNPVSSTTV